MSKARKKLPIPITSFVLSLFILSVLSSTYFVTNIVPQGIESVPGITIHTASATSEGDGAGESDQGTGDGDQGGDSGSDGDQGADQVDPQTAPTETTDTPEADLEPTEPADSEICGNSQDDDVDGSVDENCPTSTLQPSDIGCPPIVEAFGASCKPFEATPLPQEPGLPPGPGDPPPGPTGTERHEGVCDDGIDNDGDGATDTQDADCRGKTLPEFAPSESSLGRPGYVDPNLPPEAPFEEPPLAGFNPNLPPDGTTLPPEDDPSAEPPQTPPTEQSSCNDGVDNDNDGLTDSQDEDECGFVRQPPGFDPFTP
jgi:hypothetical protein